MARNQKVEIRTHEVPDEEIEIKILHLLSIYPVISPTMLQGALGPAMKPIMWRPVLEKLVKAGRVVQEEYPKMTPSDRYNTYTKLYIPGVKVTMPKVAQGD